MVQRMNMEQRRERQIAAVLRLVLVAVLLAMQIALVVALTHLLQQYMAAAYTLLEIVAVVYAFRVYTRPGSSSYKPGWILLILAVPVVGLILYWLWNGDQPSKRLALHSVPRIVESESRNKESERNVKTMQERFPTWSRLAGYLDRQGFLLYRHTECTYLASGEDFLRDMLERLAQAEHFIFMEYFIIADGAVWRQMLEIFRRKAAQGVEIRILYDDFGSMLRLPSEQLAQLREWGVEIKPFGPVHHYVNRLYFNYRDHRKITCIDGNVAYTGGVNIADEYANLVERFGYWKDCGVRLTGSGAWGLTKEFLYQWERIGGAVEREHDYYRPECHAESNGFCQVLADGPDNNPVSTAEEVFLQLISLAKREVWVTTPYLAISEPMIKALCVAGDSGVDVRLLMPGIPDHKLAFWVAESYFGELISHGVKVYRYTPGLLHGKSVMADGEAAFVGSVNMDYRSFQLHFECGTVCYGAPAVAALRQDMERIMASCCRITYGQWSRRAWYRRVLEPVLRLFAMWM